MIRDTFDFMGDETPARETEDADEVTVTLIILDDLPSSYKVSETEGGRVFFLPKSKVRVTPTGKTTQKVGHPKYSIADVTMPEWIAKDRGLV